MLTGLTELLACPGLSTIVQLCVLQFGLVGRNESPPPKRRVEPLRQASTIFVPHLTLTSKSTQPT